MFKLFKALFVCCIFFSISSVISAKKNESCCAKAAVRGCKLIGRAIQSGWRVMVPVSKIPDISDDELAQELQQFQREDKSSYVKEIIRINDFKITPQYQVGSLGYGSVVRVNLTDSTVEYGFNNSEVERDALITKFLETNTVAFELRYTLEDLAEQCVYLVFSKKSEWCEQINLLVTSPLLGKDATMWRDVVIQILAQDFFSQLS